MQIYEMALQSCVTEWKKCHYRDHTHFSIAYCLSIRIWVRAHAGDKKILNIVRFPHSCAPSVTITVLLFFAYFSLVRSGGWREM